MASRRYSRIMQAAKLYSSVDNLIKYWQDSTRRGSKVGQGEPRPKSIKLYVNPFGFNLGAGQVALTSGAEPAYNQYQTSLGTRTKRIAPTDENAIIKLANFKAARVIIKTGRSTQGVAKTSKVTGQKYLSYGGKSTSLPFGQKGGNETDAQQAAFLEIRQAIVQLTPGAIVTLQEERI